jgi:dTDP-4-dehydrorhamnose reductase
MKTLIVGCHGMLGTDLVNAFSPVHDVTGLGRSDLDIGNREQCRDVIQEFRPEIIINAAAYTRVDDCESNEETAFLINGHGAGNLAAAAALAGSLLVHYSTDYIFDGQKEDGYREDDTPNPQSVYGKSKLLGEELILRSGADHLLLRISWLFGPAGPNFIRTIIGAARKGAPLRVVDDQKGSPTYTGDLAAHTMKLIASGCRGIYHVTNSGACTWYELASHAVKCAGMDRVSITPVTSLEFSRPAPRPVNSTLINARLQKELLPLMRPWQEAAGEYVERCLKQ